MTIVFPKSWFDQNDTCKHSNKKYPGFCTSTATVLYEANENLRVNCFKILKEKHGKVQFFFNEENSKYELYQVVGVKSVSI